ncbi:methylated-DNA--[protein]-cysteine S-methyltransferase [Comamonas guangdongensis]|uniref:Methylated-DNA--[protein]-cysteine S-methyltransferase n=1 Tax=Comamonas guangdongensis TaxID=510515 RepID=A0ABV4A2R9_9BURK
MNDHAPLPFPGHALFATRIGVCAVAWNAHAVTAVQLPEASWAETRERMLLGLHKRHALQPGHAPVVYAAVTSAQALPALARQAIAGVQRLLAGVKGERDADWVRLPAEASEQGVLPDMREAYRPCAAELAEPGALPALAQIPLDEFGVPEFQARVYAYARGLKPGQTRTYGEVAAALGEPGAARAVGQALGANPFAPIVPCHRVLAAGRAPGGFSGGQGAVTKLRMLEIEGGAWGGTLSLFGD